MTASHMRQYWRAWLYFGIAGLCLISAIAISAVVLPTLKPLATTTTHTLRSEPTLATVYNPDTVCPAGAPNDCHIQLTQLTSTTTVTTTAGEHPDPKKAKLQVGLHAHTKFETTAPKQTLINIDDSVQLLKNSTLPATDPQSQITVSAPALRLRFSTDSFARDGVQYFFPFQAERRSYLYFDALAQDSYPIDYAGTVAIDDIPAAPPIRSDDPDTTTRHGETAWVFQQYIAPINLSDSVFRAFTQPQIITDDPTAQPPASMIDKSEQFSIDALRLQGSADKFYPDGTTDTVQLHPYYTVQRRLWVEPTSGVILHQVEDMYLFAARDAADAAATAAQAGFQHNFDRTITKGDPYRTLLQARFAWDEATRSQQRIHAAEITTSLFRIRLYPYVLKLVAAIFVILALLQIRNQRRRQAS